MTNPGLLPDVDLFVFCRALCDELFAEPPARCAGKTFATPVLKSGTAEALLTGVKGEVFIQVRAARDEIRVALSPDRWHFWGSSHKGEAEIEEPHPDYAPLLLGDAPFQERVQVYGQLPYSLAVMTSEMRRAVLDGASDFWGIVKVWTSPALLRLWGRGLEGSSTTNTAKAVCDALSAYGDLLRKLRLASSEIPARLGANATTDPCAGVRRTNLETAIRGYADLESTRTLCTSALTDADPDVRLVGAVFLLGEQGFPVLAELLENDSHRADLRLQAARELVVHYPAERSWPSFESAAESGTFAFRKELLTIAATSGQPELVRLLCELARRSSPDGCELIIRLLSFDRSPVVEATLIDLLAGTDLTVAGAAIEVLGDIGTSRAIAAVSDWAGNPYLGDAVKRSLKKIRKRAPSGEAGRLSLTVTVPQSGSVSLPADQGEMEVVVDGEIEPAYNSKT